jgi:chloramphenicol O-acetyltransferase type A
MRTDKTYGFSFVKFNEDLVIFLKNLELEKERIQNSKNLYPPIDSLDCIHCSALPWFSFTGHKEPVSGLLDSVPKLAFGKTEKLNNSLMMNVSIHVNHALVDGYDIGKFVEKFQYYLNK